MTAPTTARKPMQTTTVTTMATVSPTDSAAASLKRSCVAAICFLWRSSLSSCKGTLLELRIEAVVTKERIERNKEHTILCSCCLLMFLVLGDLGNPGSSHSTFATGFPLLHSIFECFSWKDSFWNTTKKAATLWQMGGSDADVCCRYTSADAAVAEANLSQARLEPTHKLVLRLCV